MMWLVLLLFGCLGALSTPINTDNKNKTISNTVPRHISVAQHAAVMCNATADPVKCMVEKIDQIVQPRPAQPFEDWPGNRMAVESNFEFGVVVGLIEAFLVIAFFPKLKKGEAVTTSCSLISRLSLGPVVLWRAILVLGGLFGWFYWLTIVTFFWNFQSWLFLIAGLALVFPPLWKIQDAERRSGKKFNSTEFNYRILSGGLLLAAVCLATYTNVPRMYKIEIHRRSYMNRDHSVIIPNSTLVKQYKADFLGNHTNFFQLDFQAQMDAVDVWVYKTITWQSDYKRWKMIGTLLSVDEVLTYREGDCEGQCVTTVSLLLALGYEAWCAETPFHWWTHARHPITGEEHNLNQHGSSRIYGSVLPQPIDMVFTRPPHYGEKNVHMHGTYYIAPPLRAIMISWTGAHILVREVLPTLSVSTLIGMGVGVALICLFYVTMLKNPTNPFIGLNWSKMLTDLAATSVVGILVMFVWYMWIVYYYPISLLHLLFCIPAIAVSLIQIAPLSKKKKKNKKQKNTHSKKEDPEVATEAVVLNGTAANTDQMQVQKRDKKIEIDPSAMMVSLDVVEYDQQQPLV